MTTNSFRRIALAQGLLPTLVGQPSVEDASAPRIEVAPCGRDDEAGLETAELQGCQVKQAVAAC